MKNRTDSAQRAITLSPEALKALHETFAAEGLKRRDGLAKDGRPCLRLGISPRGCGLPVVTITEEHEKEGHSGGQADISLEAEGWTFLLEEDLFNKVQPITLDHRLGRYAVSLGAPLTVSGCGLCPASPLQGGSCGIISGMNF